MTKRTSDPLKKNVVLMGRKTWESIPEKNRPLPGRLNIVLTQTLGSLGEDVLVHRSLDAAFEDLSERKYVETVWVIGGTSVYEEVIKKSLCDRLYVTSIHKDYECDTFFPNIGAEYKPVIDTDVPQGILEEKGVQFEYKVYENTAKMSFNSNCY